jgi:peptidoglycan/xylan/chitin deacetylase (PgdA/CDA1 family)
MSRCNVESAIKATDRLLSRAYLGLFGERNSLIPFLFHGLFRDEGEIELNHVHPQQAITIAQFRQFVEYFLNCGYQFVSPADVLGGLDTQKKYVLITFDDGYFSNLMALPVLREFKVPATFCVCTNHIRENKCFWWDVLYRERTREGVPEAVVSHEIEELKSRKTSEIEKHLTELFGRDCLKPLSDVDRPMAPGELRDFAQQQYVFLGNHTADHAILTNYSAEEIRSQIVGAQEGIREMAGVETNFIAYPNGRYNADVLAISKAAGLKLGITVDLKKNYLPLDFSGTDALRLGRFVLDGHIDIASQCACCRSELSVYRWLRVGMNQYKQQHRTNGNGSRR